MTEFSLGTIWEETLAFLRREAALLMPVALATFGVAQLLLEIGMGGKPADGPGLQSFSPQSLLLLPAMLLLLIGNLAVSRIALMPGRSVGESLSDTLRSLPRALGVMLLIFTIMAGIALVIVIAATLGAMTFRVDPRAITPNIMIVLMVPMLVIGIRMLLLVPLLSVEQPRPVEAIRRAWALSRPHFLRFVGVFAIMMMLTIILAMIQQFVVGSLFQLLALVISDGQLVAILRALVNATLEAMLSLAITLYIALIYKKVAAA